MTSLIRVQDERTRQIKVYQVNDKIVCENEYNKIFDELNRTKNYNSSCTKRNIKTGDYIHTCIFS